jgi:hypothetical protein
MSRYEKVIQWLKNNLLVTIILVAFVAITGTATLIKSVKEIRDMFFGETINVLVYNPAEISLSTKWTPEYITEQYVIGKSQPYSIPKETVIWKAYIYGHQGVGDKIRVVSGDTVIDLWISDYKVVKFLQSLKPNTNIVFTGTIDDKSPDMDLDVNVKKIYLNI